MRRILMLVAVGVLGGVIVFAGSSQTQAQTASEFSIDTGPQEVFAPIGTTVLLATEPTPEGFSGRTCTVTAQDNNNESIHLNDLLVQSGSATVTVPDIEDQAGAGSPKTAIPSELTLGDTVTVSVLIGNTDSSTGDGIMSADIVVFFACSALPTTTTTMPTTPPGIQFNVLGPICQGNIPFIQYSVVGDLAADDVATLTITDINGDLVDVLTDQPLAGQIIWPGASVDPPDWPGWTFDESGFWVEDPSDQVLRSDLTVTASVNPEVSETVSYPAASPECANPPTVTPTTTNAIATTAGSTMTRSLPATGPADKRTAITLLFAIALLSSGGAIVLAVRRPPT